MEEECRQARQDYFEGSVSENKSGLFSSVLKYSTESRMLKMRKTRDEIKDFIVYNGIVKRAGEREFARSFYHAALSGKHWQSAEQAAILTGGFRRETLILC